MENMDKQEIGLTVEAALTATHLANVYRSVDEWLKSTKKLDDEQVELILECVSGIHEKNNLLPVREFVELLIEMNKLQQGEKHWQETNQLVFFCFTHLKNILMKKATPSQLSEMTEVVKLWENPREEES